MNRIKVVSEPAELVPILRAVDTEAKMGVFREVSTDWRTVAQIKEKYGPEGVEALRFLEKMKLVETKWQTVPGSRTPEKAYHGFYSQFYINATIPVLEVSEVLHIATMPEERYAPIEKQIYDLAGEEGRFSGDVADLLKVSQTTLRALVKRSARIDFRGQRIMRFED